MAKSRKGSFAPWSNFEQLSWIRRPRQHSQHISSLNCCSRAFPLSGFKGPRHSTILSTSWLVSPSSLSRRRSCSIRKQFSKLKGSCPFVETCLRSPFYTDWLLLCEVVVICCVKGYVWLVKSDAVGAVFMGDVFNTWLDAVDYPT